MKRLLILTFICLISAFVKVQGKSSSTPIIYIDGNGVMRWSDTRREASFFGVNYTLPFAHAYRAIGYLGLDRKAAIDKDVYHISRLGLNAYLFFRTGMTRFIIDFESNNGGIVFIS